MSLNDLAALGEAIGGLAVLITVLYLAYQFRQTTIIERTAGQRSITELAYRAARDAFRESAIAVDADALGVVDVDGLEQENHLDWSPAHCKDDDHHQH